MSLGPGGFDLVVGADVVYVEEAMPALFQTIASLLDGKPEVRPYVIVLAALSL